MTRCLMVSLMTAKLITLASVWLDMAVMGKYKPEHLLDVPDVLLIMNGEMISVLEEAIKKAAKSGADRQLQHGNGGPGKKVQAVIRYMADTGNARACSPHHTLDQVYGHLDLAELKYFGDERLAYSMSRFQRLVRNVPGSYTDDVLRELLLKKLRSSTCLSVVLKVFENQ